MIVYSYVKEQSERLPGKNFRPLDGVPLWRRHLRKYAGHTVYLDTDSPEILATCDSDPDLSHVTAYARLPEHVESGDTVQMIRRLFEEFVQSDEPVAVVHATTPFVRPQTIADAARRMESGGYDSALSVTALHDFAYRQSGDVWVPLNTDNRWWPRTQDLEPIVVLNHAFYVLRRSVFLRVGHRVGERPLMVPLEYPESIDIDVEADWRMAESALAAGAGAWN